MICVIAKLASDAAERLNILRKAVASKEQLVKPFHGHITIAAYLPDDEEFLPVCAEIIRDTSAFRIRYEKLEVLSATSIIAAVPSKPAALLALHNRIAERFGKSLNRWTCGNDWYPHTTLLYDPDADLNGLCRKMQEYFVPFETCISRVEFSKAEETGYTILCSVDLKQQTEISCLLRGKSKEQETQKRDNGKLFRIAGTFPEDPGEEKTGGRNWQI